MAKATCVDLGLGLYVEGLMSSLPDQRRSHVARKNFGVGFGFRGV